MQASNSSHEGSCHSNSVFLFCSDLSCPPVLQSLSFSVCFALTDCFVSYIFTAPSNSEKNVPPPPPALAQPSPLTLCQLCVCQFKGVLADFKSTHTTTANLQLGQSDNGRCCSEEGGGSTRGRFRELRNLHPHHPNGPTRSTAWSLGNASSPGDSPVGHPLTVPSRVRKLEVSFSLCPEIGATQSRWALFLPRFHLTLFQTRISQLQAGCFRSPVFPLVVRTW